MEFSKILRLRNELDGSFVQLFANQHSKDLFNHFLLWWSNQKMKKNLTRIRNFPEGGGMHHNPSIDRKNPADIRRDSLLTIPFNIRHT
jgi:hypothetical protein